MAVMSLPAVWNTLNFAHRNHRTTGCNTSTVHSLTPRSTHPASDLQPTPPSDTRPHCRLWPGNNLIPLNGSAYNILSNWGQLKANEKKNRFSVSGFEPDLGLTVGLSTQSCSDCICSRTSFIRALSIPDSPYNKFTLERVPYTKSTWHPVYKPYGTGLKIVSLKMLVFAHC